jgi:glc operon protein GlcG
MARSSPQIRIAEGKALTAVEFRRPTKALEDAIARGGAGLRYFMEGGVPILVDGKIVGGIGVSGVDSKDDAQIAQAGADAVVIDAIEQRFRAVLGHSHD